MRLIPLEVAHAADMFAAADPELFRFTAQAPTEWSIPGFEDEIRRVLALRESVALAIVLKETGRVIGRSTFMEIKPEHRGVEIGRTWIGRAYHGTHINPEIKFLMMRHAFERIDPSAIRVAFTTSGVNLHSQRAIAKMGAVREGVLRDARTVPGFGKTDPPVVRDVVVFSVLEREWPGVKAGLLARLGWNGDVH